MSTYGYITVANLEAYTGIDYETTSATYTDAFVNAQISMAERLVIQMCIVAPGTTDGSYFATMVLSERLMRNIMVGDGYAAEMPQSIKEFFDYLIEIALKPDINRKNIGILKDVTSNYWSR